MMKGSFFFPADTNVNFRKVSFSFGGFSLGVAFRLFPAYCEVQFLLCTAQTTPDTTPLVYGMSIPLFWTV